MTLDDRIACVALQVLPPDLEVLPPASARCGLIQSFEGGLPNDGPPSFPSRLSNDSNHYVTIVTCGVTLGGPPSFPSRLSNDSNHYVTIVTCGVTLGGRHASNPHEHGG